MSDAAASSRRSGAERYGDGRPEADGEMLALALSCLGDLPAARLRLTLGWAGLLERRARRARAGPRARSGAAGLAGAVSAARARHVTELETRLLRAGRRARRGGRSRPGPSRRLRARFGLSSARPELAGTAAELARAVAIAKGREARPPGRRRPRGRAPGAVLHGAHVQRGRRRTEAARSRAADGTTASSRASARRRPRSASASASRRSGPPPSAGGGRAPAADRGGEGPAPAEGARSAPGRRRLVRRAGRPAPPRALLGRCVRAPSPQGRRRADVRGPRRSRPRDRGQRPRRSRAART